MNPIPQTNHAQVTRPSDSRKPYVVPAVEVVSLHPKETVLNFCYTDASSPVNLTNGLGCLGQGGCLGHSV